MNRIIVMWLSLAGNLVFAGSWSVEGLGQQSLKSSDLKKETTVLQFWASWCGSCSEVFWDMKKIHGSNPEVDYFTINTDPNKSNIEPYLGKLSLKDYLMERTFFDSQKRLSKSMKVKTIPTVIVLNRSGEIIKRLEGHYSSAEFLAQSVLGRESP